MYCRARGPGPRFRIGRLLLTVLSILAAACSEEISTAEHVKFFPIIAVHGGASTVFVLRNPSTQQITVKIELHSSDGSYLEKRQIHLAKGSAQRVDFGGKEGRKTPGWAQLASSDAFLATELIDDGIAPWIGFSPSKPATQFKLFATVAAKDRLTTGVALANPSSSQDSAVTAVLRDHSGREVRRTHFTLGPWRHQSS